jgi:hypothetical protein
VLMVQSSASSQQLVRRISDEAIAALDREGKLAERRQRRAARDIDYRNILIIGGDDDGGGGRSRRQRKQINYKEMDEGDITLDEEERDDRTEDSKKHLRMQQEAEEEEDEEYREEVEDEDEHREAVSAEEGKEQVDKETAEGEEQPALSQDESKQAVLPLSDLTRPPSLNEDEVKEQQLERKAQMELRPEQWPQQAADMQKAALAVHADGPAQEGTAVAASAASAAVSDAGGGD